MKILLSACFVLLQFSIFSQNWTSYYSDSKVQIDFAKVDFTDKKHGLHHERLVFRYTNKSNDELVLQFSRVLAYNQQELAHSPESDFELILAPNSSSSYSKEFERNKTYYIFVKDYNGFIKKKLTSFDIINIISK